MMTRDAEKVVSVGSRAYARQSMSQVEAGLELEFVDWTCCCCSRRRGVLILGVLFVALSLGALVLCSMASWRLSSLHMEAKNASLARNGTQDASTTTTLAPGRGRRRRTPAEELNLIKGAYVVTSAQALLAAAGACTAVALAAGAHTSRAALLVPWMVSASAEVLLLIGGGAYFAVAALSRVVPVVGLHGFYAFVAMLFLCVPLLYCIKIVHCLHKELRASAPVTRKKKNEAKRRPSSPPPPVPPTAASTSTAAGRVDQAPAKKRPPTPPVRRSRYGSLGCANPVFENTAL